MNETNVLDVEAKFQMIVIEKSDSITRFRSENLYLMKITGVLLLVTGWLLVLCAISMLKSGTARNAFVLAGMGVEALGLALAVRAHLPLRSER